MFRRFLERTAVKNPDRVLGIVERKLNGDYWLEYYAAVREATTTPEAAREGHFVKLAKDAALRVGSGFRRTDVYGMAPQAPERCTKCQAGFRSFEPREYCDCQLGRDLESIARRRAAETCKRCNGTRIIGDPNASPITLCPDCFARDPQQAREISTRVH